MDKIKTFEFTCSHGTYTCCACIADDNSIFIYAKDNDGCWDLDGFMDATVNVSGVFVPDGHVCIKNDRENAGIMEALENIGIIHEPAFSIPYNMDTLYVCKVDPQKAAEWNAWSALYGE